MKIDFCNVCGNLKSVIRKQTVTHLTHCTCPGGLAEKYGVIRTVRIPSRTEHEGIYHADVRLVWNCLVCGKRRGEPSIVRSYDGSRILYCHGWINPCGHVDKYSYLRMEAATNGLNKNIGILRGKNLYAIQDDLP